MTRSLSSSDLALALHAAATWHAADSQEEFETAALAALYDLVPCDGVGWNDVDLRTGEVHLRVAPFDYKVDPIETLNRLIDRRLAVEDQLALLVSVTADQIIGIAFNRGRRSFTERDRALLDLLHPHLAAAARNLALRTDAAARITALERGLDSRTVIALNTEGRIADPSPRGRAVLELWFGCIPQSLAPGWYARSDAGLRVRQLDGDPPLLVLDEQRHQPDPERVREAGLTARETEIIALAGRGLSDAEIASELYVSARTVSKHLEHVYAKLGVHARADAWARLMSS